MADSGMKRLQTGPCVVCGLKNYALSMGGPTICPACDCGNSSPQTVRAQASEITTLRSELAALAGSKPHA